MNDQGAQVCIYDLYKQLLKSGAEAVLNDWVNYNYYDFAIFMSYDHDMEQARLKNSNIKIILADPKMNTKVGINAAQSADLLLVSSIEQRDAFLRLNPNILIHYMFPEMNPKIINHINHSKLCVAYHGNRVHLEAMRQNVLPALEAFAKVYPVELLCIYNINMFGKVNFNELEKHGVKVRHVQWNKESLLDELSKADIGIMPNELPIRNRHSALIDTAFPIGEFAYEPFDHLVRYKISANPGRLVPFVCAGLPVIADFCPSASQFIRDGESGYIASSPEGWYYAFTRLAESETLRRLFAERLSKCVLKRRQQQVDNLQIACKKLNINQPLYRFQSTNLELELSYLNRYIKPQRSFSERLVSFIRRKIKI